MAKREQDGCGALAAIALIAFILGRCSAGETPPRDAAAVPSSVSGAAEIDAASNALTPPEVAPDIERAPEPEPPPVRFVSPAPSRLSGTSFRNCSEARAAGAAPVMEGDPGYAPRLDRDGDGVGCE